MQVSGVCKNSMAVYLSLAKGNFSGFVGTYTNMRTE
jgi:hypothetical protein